MNDMQLVITLPNKVDSSNAIDLLKDYEELIRRDNCQNVVINFNDTNLMSSIGLRLLLTIRKEVGELKLVNVNNDIYDMLSFTGFINMFDAVMSI